MQKLLFFSRVAFICNCCFIITFLMHFFPAIPEEHISATIIVLGYGMGLLLNIAIIVCYAWQAMQKQLKNYGIPSWLVVANCIFLLPEILIVVIQ